MSKAGSCRRRLKRRIEMPSLRENTRPAQFFWSFRCRQLMSMCIRQRRKSSFHRKNRCSRRSTLPARTHLQRTIIRRSLSTRKNILPARTISRRNSSALLCRVPNRHRLHARLRSRFRHSRSRKRRRRSWRIFWYPYRRVLYVRSICLRRRSGTLNPIRHAQSAVYSYRVS